MRLIANTIFICVAAARAGAVTDKKGPARRAFPDPEDRQSVLTRSGGLEEESQESCGAP